MQFNTKPSRILKGHGMGLLPDTWNCGLRMRRGCRERFPHRRLQRKSLVSDPGMHPSTCHVPWCMSGFVNQWWRGKSSRHSWRMRNPQFYKSGKRPMVSIFNTLSKRERIHHIWWCGPNSSWNKLNASLNTPTHFIKELSTTFAGYKELNDSGYMAGLNPS